MTQPEEARRPESEVNPYSAPSTPSETLARAPRNSSSHQRRKVLSSDLAGLAARFVGNLIDYTPFIIGYSAVAFAEATQVDISPWSVPVFVSCTVLFLAVQAFLVATRSQSIGKFCLGTQTVIHNGARAGFWRITLLRNALPNFIPCFNLIDPFFIFGMRRQCLHDMISGTYVVHYSAERR